MPSAVWKFLVSDINSSNYSFDFIEINLAERKYKNLNYLSLFYKKVLTVLMLGLKFDLGTCIKKVFKTKTQQLPQKKRLSKAVFSLP